MLTRDRLAELAADAGFGDIAGDLAALALPALRLEAGGDDARPGASRLGGLPDLPDDVAWPHAPWPGLEHEAMAFFGQLALADLDPAIWPGPRDGTLSFFCFLSSEYYGADREGSAKVLHLPPGAALAPREPPPGLFEEFLFDGFGVRARPELTLPTIAVDVAPPLHELGFGWEQPRHAQDDAYEALTIRLWEEQGFPAKQPNGAWAPRHRLLGWPRHVQGDVFPELAPGNDRGRDWRLLLQIESDRRLAAGFGDGGTLFFGLPDGDLEAGRFDRVEGLTQTG